MSGEPSFGTKIVLNKKERSRSGMEIGKREQHDDGERLDAVRDLQDAVRGREEREESREQSATHLAGAWHVYSKR